MARPRTITATFATPRAATAAIDWFLNQAIDRDAITVSVIAPGEQARPSRSGDNRRADLTWVVAVDTERARLPLTIVNETMRREGGKLSR